MKCFVVSIVSVLALLASSKQVSGQEYQVIDLGVNGEVSSVATAINNFGQVVGTYTLAGSENHAFLFSGGSMSDIGVNSYGYGVNDKGEAVGTMFFETAQTSHAFLYTSSTLRDLTPSVVGNSVARDINNNSQITGSYDYSFDGTNRSVAFSSDGVKLTPLTELGLWNEMVSLNDFDKRVGAASSEEDATKHRSIHTATGGSLFYLKTIYHNDSLFVTSYAKSVNNSGQIVGWASPATDESDRYAFYFSGFGIQDLNKRASTTGLYFSEAASINDLGQIIGSAINTTTNSSTTFLYNNTSAIDLNQHLSNSGWTITKVSAINNVGQVVGQGTFNGQSRAVLLTPTTMFKTEPVNTYVPPTRMPLPDPLPPPETHKKGLIFITHGWNSHANASFQSDTGNQANSWALDLRFKINTLLYENGVSRDWDVVAYDWWTQSGYNPFETDPITHFHPPLISPDQAAQNAFQIGVSLGKQFDIDKYDTIQLIGHSAGSWLIEGLTEELRARGGMVPIQETFLDAYTPLGWQEKEPLGDKANFAEEYYDGRASKLALALGSEIYGTGTIGAPLMGVYSLNVSKFDPVQSKPVWESHGWPCDWYEDSLGSGYGLDLSPSITGQTASYDQYHPFGVADVPTIVGIDSIDKLPSNKSDTGTVQLADSLIDLTTGSPVWVSLVIPVTEESNFLTFDIQFVDGNGAEGLLSVFWEGTLIGTVDERCAVDRMYTYSFLLPETVSFGQYALAFRLDPSTEVTSQVNIQNVGVGFAVPEPCTIVLILGVCPVLLTRCR